MKSISLLSDLLSRVTDIGKRLNASNEDQEKTLIEQCEGLLYREGEATNLAHAQQILKNYKALEPADKKQFFEEIVSQFGVDVIALENEVEKWLHQKDEVNARRLHFASEPSSQSLFRRLNQAPNATLDLVQMRTDLLSFTKEYPTLRELDKDLSHLFASWFNRGFLQLKRIDWSTAAAVLEKIIAYEAVHEISGWDDLRQRVAASDRRLYAYFHPALGTEPLIFVEVALTTETPSAIGPILEADRTSLSPENATTAVFYSISNCQKGLRGISFGNFLIKQVVETLRHEFENLETFVTLSPVPGLRQWALKQRDNPDTILSHDDLNVIEEMSLAEKDERVSQTVSENKGFSKIVAKYLVESRAKNGGALDPVARFHIGNGAQLENIHVLADVTANGFKNSWGTMVNYQYRVDDIEKNHETYFNQGTIAVSQNISRLLSKK